FAGIGTDARGNLPPIQGFEQPVVRIRTLGTGDGGTIVVQKGEIDGIAERAITVMNTIKSSCNYNPFVLNGP
ncbi:MAG: hypothetical protein MUF14_02660, partial [Hyphomonadaceae bacterium]|nr:hypothetical protein [Hyphomonadaceae bacterium]